MGNFNYQEADVANTTTPTPIKHVVTAPRINPSDVVHNKIIELCQKRGITLTEFRRQIAKFGINTDASRLLLGNIKNSPNMSAIVGLMAFFECPFDEIFEVDWDALRKERENRG